MRYKDSPEQQQVLRIASDDGRIELIYASLDVLGTTPWKINQKVFKVVLEVWNSGKRLGKVPAERIEDDDEDDEEEHY